MFLSTWEEFTRAAEKLQGESFFIKMKTWDEDTVIFERF